MSRHISGGHRVGRILPPGAVLHDAVMTEGDRQVVEVTKASNRLAVVLIVVASIQSVLAIIDIVLRVMNRG